MAIARTPRTAWIEEGLRALARGGPRAVRIEALAQSIGVSKGGFYWYFDGRPALLEEMLDAWERMMVDEVIEQVERAGGDARARLHRLFTIASSRRRLEGIAGLAARDLLELELAIRDWGRSEQSVARRLRRVDNRRMDYMRSLFAALCRGAEDVEARCLLVMSLFVANRLIAADHGSRTRAGVVRRALALLEEPAGAEGRRTVKA
jgi:AcrR family transcriptional regulator